MLLVCLLGNDALAQKKSASNTSFTHEVYDFTQSTNNYGTSETATTICTGSWEFNENWGGTKYDIASSNLNNLSSLAVGHVIRVNFTPNSGGTSDGAIKKRGTYDDLPGLSRVTVHSDYYEAVINSSEAVNEITSNGLTLQAAYMTITSIQVVSTNNDALTWNGNNLVAVSGTTFPKADRISVSSTSGWNIWSSDENQCSYLQRASNDVRYVYINNLNVGDIVRIWCQGDCRILSDNTASHNSSNPLVWDFNDPYPNNRRQDIYDRQGVQLKETLYRTRENQDSPWNIVDQNPDGNELKIVNDHENGSLVIKLATRWAGILKVEIDAVNTNPRYDYDPGFEVYDMFDTRSQNNNTAYTANESAGFTLNNSNAYYLKFTNNDLTLNERLAVSTTSGWTFARGIQAPNYSLDNDSWYNLSICNLREGDRVLIYYTGDAPTFSSNGENGDYTGSAAFKDTWNDGMLDTGEGDHKISKGDPVEYTYCRDEGNIAQDEDVPHVWIYTSYPYVMMENGHLDLAIRNGNRTRIVKIKIYSDHQAMMVDDYNNETYTYTAYYNITGELQAKEHIVPGGLEVHVGNDATDQHANVVFSKEGPVSYVKAVDGFKIPGIYKDNNGQIQNNYNLANEAPTTGTYYRFIPEATGKLTVRFKATSLNYYRWNIPADAIYFDDPDITDPAIVGDNHGWTTEFDRANEWPMDKPCPYYLMVKDGDSYTSATFKVNNNNNSSTGAINLNNEYCTLTLDVQAGKTYYLYGTWSGNNGDGNNIGSPRVDLKNRNACGIAQLLWVEFAPENKIYPLAKWVPSGTTKVNDDTDGGVPNPDDLTTKEYELADVIGYVDATITVKKMSGNITACRPYIKRARPNDREGKLMIDGIQFASNKNPGGTILIKIGDPELKTSPLYALTIAYSTDPKYNGENGLTGDDGRGHTWDLTTNSLYGMKWDLAHDAYVKSHAPYNTTFTTSTGGYATPIPMGTYFQDYYANEAAIANFTKVEEVWDYFHNTLSNGINIGSLLEEEIDYNDHHGITRSDWTFNYNLVYGDRLFDPIFSNKYDMEGDNADMIWDTEGTVIRTSANQSVIFNEFTGDDIHSSAKDPNRYVGILEGGEFRIPWLRPNDRVIIYMGTGTGRNTDEVKFSIKNSYDAVYNAIDPTDDYIVGGSQWNGANNDNNYRGCYHFFAEGDGKGGPADMVFKMKEGSLCKIYKIQIYRGDRIITNEVVGETSGDKFLLWSRAADPNDTNDEAAMGDTYNWTLKYFGKAQKLADGTNGVKNDFAAKTGCINYDLATSTETDPTKPTYNTFSYPNDYGQIGTFRARGKDMEKNMKYVADYGEHNVTIAYQQTMEYPYTWDFMDMTGWGNNVQNFVYEDGIGSLMTSRPAWYDSDDLWNASYEKSSSDLSLWEVDSQDNTYYLRLNSQSGQTSGNLKEVDDIFETAKDIDGNQVWANGAIVPETQGLWFYTLNNNRNNGTWGVTNDGLTFNGLSTTIQKVVIPNVPAGAAVYLRMVTDRDAYAHEFEFKGGNSGYKVYGPELVARTTDEYILAIKNDGAKRHLTLSLAGYQLKKLSVSTDPKSVNIKGYASESRDHAIDASLLPYFTDKPIKSYLVSDPDYTGHTITLTDVSESPAPVVPTESGYVI